jgi:hypothetical protein
MRCRARTQRWLIGGLGVLGVFAVPPAAKAVFQVFTASGTITAITGSELDTVFDVGDPFVAMAVYDDALLTGVGSEEISLNPNINTGHSFHLTIGDPAVLTFDETDDSGFDPLGIETFPEIEFLNGSFDEFDFISNTVEIEGVSFAVTVTSDLSIAQPQGPAELIGQFSEFSQEPVSPH